MKKKFILCLSLFLSRDAFSQNNNAESLRHLLSTAKEDTNKVWLFLNLGGIYQWSYPDSAVLYAQKALELAQKLNFINGEISAYGLESSAFSDKGNYPKALEMGLKQLELSEKSRDSTSIIWAYVAIGSAYYFSNNYERALYYFNRLNSNHAMFLQNQKLFSGFLGETYFYLNQPDSALYYTKMSYDLDIKSDDHWPPAYFYLGEIYSQKKEYALALDYYHSGINASIVKLDFLIGYIGIAGVFKKMKSIDSAVHYARLAVNLVHDGSFPSKIVEASKILTDIYTTNHVTDSVLKYTLIMMMAKDSLFSQAKQNLYFNEQLHQQELQQKIEQEKLANKNRQNIIILLAGLAIILIISIGLWRKNIYKQKSYAILKKQKQETDSQKTKVENTLEELRMTQAQLIQSEKMASLGELTAGIAHEIQNPLNFVTNFSEVNRELITEMKTELHRDNKEDAISISNRIDENEQKIHHHGLRADAIVKGMLLHSREGRGQKESTDLNALADEYLRLSYHGFRAKDKSFHAQVQTNFDPAIGKVDIVRQDIGRVLLNLYNNAFYAISTARPEGDHMNSSTKRNPTLRVSTKRQGDKILISVKDNGAGIPQNVVDKIFQPFFTTKPTGTGTGLGLSLSYDIIKAHGGEIKVETEEGMGSEFGITLPIGQVI